MTRTEFQQLADVRIAEAKTLLDAGQWDGAYYLAGYAAECALKACIAKRTKAEEFPPNRKVIEDYYTHDLNTLLRAAGLVAIRDAEIKVNPRFQSYWAEVVRWTEQSRYERKAQRDAEELYNAINDSSDGVLQWVRGHW